MAAATNNIIVLPSVVQDLINKIAGKEGFIKHTIKTSPGCDHADGFFGIIIRVTINGMRNDKFDELSLIVKTVPDNEFRRKHFSTSMIFEREIFIYNEFLPIIEKFQKEKGLTDETGFFSYPKCYGTISDSSTYTYCLVLEDLKTSGFQMWNKLGTIELDQVELVIKQYAKLHAVSFALRDQKPEVLEKFFHMKDTVIPMMANEEMKAMSNMAFDKAVAALNDNEKEARDKLNELRDLKHMEFCVSKENSEPFTVICHGDCWTNNMMFSYKEPDNKLDKVYFIDWQVTRAASPVIDFLYFFFTSAQKPLRDQHYNRIVKTYYDTLANTIKSLGSDAEKLFTFDNLQEQLKKFGKFAIIMGIFLIQTIIMDPKDVPDMDKMVEDMDKMDLSKFEFMNKSLGSYNKRISELIRDLIDLGYI